MTTKELERLARDIARQWAEEKADKLDEKFLNRLPTPKRDY